MFPTTIAGSLPNRLALSRLLGRHGRRLARRVAPNSPAAAGGTLHELESKLQFTADVYGVSVLRHLRHVRGIKRFFADAANGTLPAFSIVDPSFVDFSEETPQDIQLGERFAATVVGSFLTYCLVIAIIIAVATLIERLNMRSNKIGRANRCPASLLDATCQFGRAPCAPPSLSAAVDHLSRSARSAQKQIRRQRRLPPVAHPDRSATFPGHRCLMLS